MGIKMLVLNLKHFPSAKCLTPELLLPFRMTYRRPSPLQCLGFKGVVHPNPCLTQAFCSLSSVLSSGSNTSQL